MLVIQIPTVNCSYETVLINTAGFRLVKLCGQFIYFKDFGNLRNTAVQYCSITIKIGRLTKQSFLTQLCTHLGLNNMIIQQS